MPTASVVVAAVATPAPLSAPEPIEVAPSRKVTVPVGTPPPGATAATVDVSAMDWPNTVGDTGATTKPLVVSVLLTT